MQDISFNLQRWSAWAPGLDSVGQWQSWADGQQEMLVTDITPALPFIKPMLRRRCSRLSKMALHVAYDCVGDAHNIRTVFGSRHGEIHRTKLLLDDIVKQEPISPMGFSLSVHNTASGLYSIASGNRQPSSAIAAGLDTLEMAVIDAVGHLNNEPDAPVLVVLADEPLPDFYKAYDQENAAPYALALLLTADKMAVPSEGQRLSLTGFAKGASQVSNQPHGLQLLRFLLGQQKNYQSVGERLQWVWQKND